MRAVALPYTESVRLVNKLMGGGPTVGRLVRRAGSASERFWDCLDGDGPQVAYVISNSGV